MAAINTVLSTTLEKSRKKLILASIKSNAFMAWAFANNRVEKEDGGHNITNPLVVGRNSNVASYTYYDNLPVAQTDEFDKLTYTWSRVAGTVIISGQEEDENTGRAEAIKIVKAKMMILEESIKEKFSGYLYASGAGNDPNGLQNLIADDPTTGTLGGISRATQTQWRNSAYDFNGTLTANNIEEAFDDVLLDLTLKGEKPALILVGRNIFRLYRQAVRDKVTIPLSELKNGQGMMDLGFGGIAHAQIPIIYDEDCPVNKAYFINDKYIRLHILRNVNMVKKKLAAPWTLDASGERIIWQGQFCAWKQFRTNAVLINDV